ncbi:MAG: hypothetical protein RDV48_11885 [Candidatus Eremiobacteraeota bacterium]|nr:hypothetical protein [Candidatus Eremiobacteraeota bacterium]
MQKILMAVLITLFLASLPVCAGETSWYKGMTHCHTNESDGDSPPDVTTFWYRHNSYNFRVITDHNKVTSYKGLNSRSFIVIPGEEVTAKFEKKHLHVNAINIKETMEPESGEKAYTQPCFLK